jgi:hypothetical protein
LNKNPVKSGNSGGGDLQENFIKNLSLVEKSGVA